MKTKQYIIDRVSLSDLENPNGCWNWLGYIADNGYGNVGGGDIRGAHQLAYILWNGAIPEGCDVAHSCDNKSCVNPRHLIAQIRGENIREAWDRGLCKLPLGEDNNNAKLTEEIVLNIKLSNESNSKLAERLGVCLHTVANVRRGHTWEHLTEDDIKEVKRIKGVPSVAVARMFLITPKRVEKIRRDGVLQEI